MTIEKQKDDMKRRLKFLVVDDLPVMRKMYRIALNNLGYRNIVEVENGARAIEELEKALAGSFNLMLLDLNMPETCGMDVLKFVRSKEVLKKLPVIVITAENSKDVVLQTMYYGVNEYMIKPITQKDVMEKVEKVLSDSGAQSG